MNPPQQEPDEEAPREKAPREKRVRPDSDFSTCVAAFLEGRVIVHPHGVAVYENDRWTEVTRQDGLHRVLKRAALEIFTVDTESKLRVKHGKVAIERYTRPWHRVKAHDFLTSLRMEVSADLAGDEPVFNGNRHLLAFANGKVYDFKRGQLVDAHPGMLMKWQVPWPMEELHSKSMREYRAVVSDIVRYWRESKPSRPDLQVVREQLDDDEAEPRMLHLGKADLLERYTAAAKGLEYTRTRLRALRNNVDTLIYKEPGRTPPTHHLELV